METKFNVGEEVYFKGTIENITILPSGRIIYKIKEHGDIVFSEERLIKIDAPIVKKAYVKLIPDTSEVDEAMEKAKRITDLINEAMKLADSIAKKDLNLRIVTELNGESAVLARIATE